MKIKLTLTKQEIKYLRAVMSQAGEVATVMEDGGKEGGQMKDAAELWAGCMLIQDIIRFSENG